MNTPLSLDASVLQIIERDFQGLFSGELGLSSIKGGQSAADETVGTENEDFKRHCVILGQPLNKLKG